MSLPTQISLLARMPSAQSAGFGNVDGPASSTNNAVALFDGTTGKLLKNSSVTVSGSAVTGDSAGLNGSSTTSLGYLGVPQNSQSAAYTTVLADAGKEIYHPVGDNNARTFTIDSNANVAYPIGTVIVFTNMAAANVTIAITSDTLYWFGTGGTGNRTLAQYGTAAARKLTSTTWGISGTNVT